MLLYYLMFCTAVFVTIYICITKDEELNIRDIQQLIVICYFPILLLLLIISAFCSVLIDSSFIQKSLYKIGNTCFLIIDKTIKYY